MHLKSQPHLPGDIVKVVWRSIDILVHREIRYGIENIFVIRIFYESLNFNRERADRSPYTQNLNHKIVFEIYAELQLQHKMENE